MFSRAYEDSQVKFAKCFHVKSEFGWTWVTRDRLWWAITKEQPANMVPWVPEAFFSVSLLRENMALQWRYSWYWLFIGNHNAEEGGSSERVVIFRSLGAGGAEKSLLYDDLNSKIGDIAEGNHCGLSATAVEHSTKKTFGANTFECRNRRSFAFVV